MLIDLCGSILLKRGVSCLGLDGESMLMKVKAVLSPSEGTSSSSELYEDTDFKSLAYILEISSFICPGPNDFSGSCFMGVINLDFLELALPLEFSLLSIVMSPKGE